MPASITLTSFRDSKNHKGEKFSIARWQPQGYYYHTITYLSPINPFNGKPMVHLEPNYFRDLYEKILNLYQPQILHQLTGYLVKYQNLVLCCWCHPDRQKQYPTLYCHSILLGYWLEEQFPGIPILYHDGRDRPLWDRHITLSGVENFCEED